jgi:hypothetical protein
MATPITPAQAGPAPAFDGTNFLAVWDKYTTNYDIYGARVTAGGEVLGESPLFAALGEQVFSAVAFRAGEYLVVWRDTRTGSGPNPGTDIYGARVSPQGTVLDPQGIALCTVTNVQGEPAVAFDGQNFLLVWDDGRLDDSLFHIYGTRVSPSGALLDGPHESGGIAINQAPVSKSYPRLCYDGRDMFVTWWAYSYSPPSGIFGARLSHAGILLDGPASGLGIPIASPDGYATLLALPNPVCGRGAILVPYLLMSQSKSIRANLIVPRPIIMGLELTPTNTAGVTLVLQTRQNQRYNILAGAELSDPGNWITVVTNLVGTGGLLQVQLPPSASSRQFFRAEVDY